MSEYELKFLDGPAMEQHVIMVVPPSQRRWFVQKGDVTWWTIDGPPPEDETVVVTEYAIIGHSMRSDGALVTYGMVPDAV